MGIYYYDESTREGVIHMENRLTSLITRTPEEGFDLAIKLSQKGVEKTQPSETIRKKLRPKYSRNADSLIAVSHVIATNFQTVAAANNYWNGKTKYH